MDKNIGLYIVIGALLISLAILLGSSKVDFSILDPSNLEEANLNLNTSVSTRDFYLEVAKGNIEGHSYINKFGHNEEVATGTDPEDVWTGGGIYDFYPSTGQSCNIYSTSSDDTNGGIGANLVYVYGLDENWVEINETVYLDGTNNVNLNETYIRMFRGVVFSVGSSDSNIGDIIVNCNGSIALYILAGDGQTQQAIYTIPINKTGYFIKGYVAISKGGGATVYGAEFKWKIRHNNGFTGAWETKGQMETTTHGSSWWQYEYGIPAGKLLEKTDIRIEATEVTGTLGVVGGFDILLVDNNLGVVE